MKFWKIANIDNNQFIPENDKMLLWKGFSDFDFWFYAKGFYKSANSILKNKSNNCSPHDDTLVFPVIHNIHMFLELSLKHFLFNLNNFHRLRQEDSPNLRGHDLKNLCNDVKILSKNLDKRLDECFSEIEIYINDFYYEFPNGNEISKYPWDNANNKERLIVNDLIFSVSYLQKSLKEIRELIKEFSYLVDSLKSEYETRTYTKNLSRKDIEKIAKKLPIKSKWGNLNFTKIKTDISKEYSLSNNEFSKCINVIEKHKEFSKYIGIESKLNYLTQKDIKNFLKIPIRNYLERENNPQDILARLKEGKINEFYKFLNSLDYDKIIELYALYELQKTNDYIEFLDSKICSLKESFPSEERVIEHFSSKSLSYVKDKIEEQTKKLGII